MENLRAVRCPDGQDRREGTRVMMVDTKDLVCSTDIAEMFGVTRSAVSNWAARTSGTPFPEPVARIGMGPLYSRKAVLAWYRARHEGRARQLEQQAVMLRGWAAAVQLEADKLRKAVEPDDGQGYTLTVP